MTQFHPTRLFSIAIAAHAFACSRITDARLSQLHARQSAIDARVAADEQRAADLRVEVQQLEDVLQMQRTCLERQACWVQVARVNAAIAAELAECNRKSANWFACEAERTRNKADGTGLGCLLGWGFAAATGGSIAPSIAIGCGLGAKHSESHTRPECVNQPRPMPCGQIPALLTRSALSSIGLSKMPTCEPMPYECELLNSFSR